MQIFTHMSLLPNAIEEAYLMPGRVLLFATVSLSITGVLALAHILLFASWLNPGWSPKILWISGLDLGWYHDMRHRNANIFHEFNERMNGAHCPLLKSWNEIMLSIGKGKSSPIQNWAGNHFVRTLREILLSEKGFFNREFHCFSQIKLANFNLFCLSNNWQLTHTHLALGLEIAFEVWHTSDINICLHRICMHYRG